MKAKRTSDGVSPALSDFEFWRRIGVECARCAQKWPSLGADRGPRGTWELRGPYAAQAAFMDIAEAASARMGHRGTRLGALQFWLDHMNGEHIHGAGGHGYERKR